MRPGVPTIERGCEARVNRAAGLEPALLHDRYHVIRVVGVHRQVGFDLGVQLAPGEAVLADLLDVPRRLEDRRGRTLRPDGQALPWHLPGIHPGLAGRVRRLRPVVGGGRGGRLGSGGSDGEGGHARDQRKGGGCAQDKAT